MTSNRLVLGTVGLGGIWGPIDPVESVDAILAALEAGVTAIDTAPAYGNAELYVGAALRQWRGSRPFISSKVGRLQGFSATEGRYDYGNAAMQRSVEQSLQMLEADRLDLLFLHDPAHLDSQEAERVVGQMVAFRDQGLALKIGLGGNPPAWCRPYLEAGVFDVLMEFNRLNACTLESTEANLPLCQQLGIQYYAASPLMMGLLGSSYRQFVANPPVWISAQHVNCAVQLQALSEQLGLKLATLAHRFLLALPYDFKIVAGASNKEQLQSTLEDFAAGPLEPAACQSVIQILSQKQLLNA